MSTATETSWTLEALCATMDPDALFVPGNEQRTARRACEMCPVRLQCLADALESGADYGIWGGLTERERRALLRARPDVEDWESWLLGSEDDLARELRARRRPKVFSFRRTS